MSALDDLAHLVPPPGGHRAPIDWTAVEAKFETKIPADYKELIGIYGDGRFDDFLHVYQPVSPYLTIDLAFQAKRQEEILQYLRDSGREVIPYQPGELQAVAGTDNGDTLYWHRTPRDDPDAWTIVGNAARDDVWPRFAGGLVPFLVAILSREVRFEIFPEDFPSLRPDFSPPGPPNEHAIASLRAQGLYRDL